MFGYRSKLRASPYIGGTMQAFSWRIMKWFLIFMFICYLAAK